jgi:hypothetical protein
MPGCCLMVAVASAIQAVGSSSQSIAGLDGAGEWLCHPGHRTSNKMDFFLWGHFKALIYSSPVDFEEDLIASVVKAAATWHF